jgi:DNA-binding transcriptional regulator YiaG
MTPTDLRAARKTLGLTQSGLARALRLSPKNGDRSVRIWETEGNTVPGPVQVAVGMMLATRSLPTGGDDGTV